MKTIKFRIAIAALIFYSFNIFAQNNELYKQEFSAYQNYFNTQYGIQFNIPEKFSDMKHYNAMWKVRKEKDKHTGFMYGPLLQSDDKDCIIMYPALALFDKNDIANRTYPEAQMKAEIKTALGYYYSPKNRQNNDSIKINLNDLATLTTGKKAQERYNADSIYIFDIPGADSTFFIDPALEAMRKNNYPYCTSIFIIKNNSAFLNLKILFTKKGIANKDKYIERLNKQIWYKDLN